MDWPELWLVGLLGPLDSPIQQMSVRERGTDRKSAMKRALSRLVRIVDEAAPDGIGFWAGANGFDREVVLAAFETYHRRALRTAESWPWFNLCLYWRAHLAAPAFTWSLKAFGEATSDGMDGWLAGSLVSKYLEGGPEPDWESLEAYNRSDLEQMRDVHARCCAAILQGATATQVIHERADHPTREPTREVDWAAIMDKVLRDQAERSPA
jgi:hypothetical protein